MLSEARIRAVSNQTKDFWEEYLDFLATVLIGWAVLNLPKIIKLAEGTNEKTEEIL